MIIAETDRLILRHLQMDDGEPMDRIFCDADVMFYGQGVQTSEWVRNWLHGLQAEYYDKWGLGLWAVVVKSSQETIGYCGLSQLPSRCGQDETEIGYRLARAYWGLGYATEAAHAVRDCAFATLRQRRLIAMIDPRNIASIRVAEKIGMQYEKDVMFEGYTHPDGVYAMSRPNV